MNDYEVQIDDDQMLTAVHHQLEEGGDEYHQQNRHLGLGAHHRPWKQRLYGAP